MKAAIYPFTSHEIHVECTKTQRRSKAKTKIQKHSNGSNEKKTKSKHIKRNIELAVYKPIFRQRVMNQNLEM